MLRIEETQEQRAWKDFKNHKATQNKNNTSTIALERSEA